MEFPSDLGQWCSRALESHDGGPRNDLHVSELREGGYQFVCHSVSEVFLSGIAGKVLQWENRLLPNAPQASAWRGDMALHPGEKQIRVIPLTPSRLLGRFPSFKYLSGALH